jgi:hypothetical protein
MLVLVNLWMLGRFHLNASPPSLPQPSETNVRGWNTLCARRCIYSISQNQGHTRRFQNCCALLTLTFHRPSVRGEKHDRVSRTLGLEAYLFTANSLHPPLLDNVSVAVRRYCEGYAMAGFLIAVALTVLASVLFDD